MKVLGEDGYRLLLHRSALKGGKSSRFGYDKYDYEESYYEYDWWDVPDGYDEAYPGWSDR